MCEKNNLDYKLPEQSGLIYDIIINNHFCQCKFSSNIESKNCFTVNLQRCGGHKKHGNSIMIPYSKDSKIDFVIIETSYGDFYIIPVIEFHNRNIFSDSENKGLTAILVHKNDSISKKSKYLWTKSYIDKFELLTKSGEEIISLFKSNNKNEENQDNGDENDIINLNKNISGLSISDIIKI